MRPPTVGNCSLLTASCSACATFAKCGWCHVTNTCVERASASPLSCPSLAIDSSSCTSCEEHFSCRDCTQALGCAWAGNRCYPKSRASGFSSTITNNTQCPSACGDRSQCGECLIRDASNSGSLCAWCSASNACISRGLFTGINAYGQCSSVVTDVCEAPCAAHRTLDECSKHDRCGWCFNEVSPS